MSSEFFSRPAGYLALLGIFVIVAGGAIAWRFSRGQPVMAPAAAKAVASLPKVFTRPGARFVPQSLAPMAAKSSDSSTARIVAAPVAPAVRPLRLWTEATKPAARAAIRLGCLIPCETLITIESSLQATPLIAVVTENVWVNGAVAVSAGSQVHGRFTLDRSGERLIAEGAWTIVPQAGATDRSSYIVQGTALEYAEGAAGLRGQVLHPGREDELKLFASTFLSSATLALQDLRGGAGPLGASSLPAATARNATLAGTSAVLRDYAQQLREALVRDGSYVRVPEGTPFNLYVTAAPSS